MTPLAYQRIRQQAAVDVIGDRADADLVRFVAFHPAGPEDEWPPDFAPSPPGAILPDTPECRNAQRLVAVNWHAIDALAQERGLL
jgi:hypothetical protein